METNNKRQPSSEDDDLTLSLSLGSSPVRSRQSTALLPTTNPLMPSTGTIDTNPQDHAQDLAREDVNNNNNTVAASRSGRSRRGSSKGKSETVPPPFPWATDRRATIYSYDHLCSIGVKFITGEVRCKRCEKTYEMEFNLEEKLLELLKFIKSNKNTMHNRAPKVWEEPVLPNCKHCGQENSVEPLLTKKRAINWLFLLLGQMLGCCKIRHLKYFCKHTNDHRTGAKDRILYSTYIGLFIQFVPEARTWLLD